MRYFLDITYDGTAFSGWQIQANANSIQEEIEKALSLLLRKETPIVGSGRTDAGVHAWHQIAHFDASDPVDQNLLQYKLNSILSKEISINSIIPVKNETHARFDATSRTYHYHIHQAKNPFKKNQSYYFLPKVDLDLINKGCEIIKNHQNFECFSKVHTEVNHFNCEIFESNWMMDGFNHQFLVCANRFLRGMVRAMVGTLLDVGQKKTSLKQLELILESNDRNKAGRAVPAEGLFLAKVEYPTEVYI